LNPETTQPKKKCCNPEVYAYGLAILGVFLIVAGLVWVMYHFTRPEPLGIARAKERKDALQTLRAENDSVLNNYAWQDASKGIVRLPIADAMKLMESKWSKDPVMARSNLIERVEKANYVPPKPPEKPSAFE
jgi:hypothetical protein